MQLTTGPGRDAMLEIIRQLLVLELSCRTADQYQTTYGCAQTCHTHCSNFVTITIFKKVVEQKKTELIL